MFWNSVLTAAYKVISKLEGGDQTPSKVSTILKILKKDKLFNKKKKNSRNLKRYKLACKKATAERTYTYFEILQFFSTGSTSHM